MSLSRPDGRMPLSERRARRHAHPMIFDQACELAAVVYEATAMKSHKFYSANPNQYKWVIKNSGNFIAAAREALSLALASPGLDDVAKHQIYEALIMDNTLKLGRNRPGDVQIMGDGL